MKKPKKKIEKFKQDFIDWCTAQIRSSSDGEFPEVDNIAYILSVEEMCRIAVYFRDYYKKSRRV